MAYQDLTPTEKAELDAWLNDVRAWARQYGRILTAAQALIDLHDANVAPILTQLQPSDAVPNRGGLRGAGGLERSEIDTIVSFLNARVTADTSAASRRLRAKAGGVRAGLED